MSQEYFNRQLTGSKCAGKNCAAASAAMAIAYGTGGRIRLTADDVRARAAVSCVPGVHTPSGGLLTSDVKRVAALEGVHVDYGAGNLQHWSTKEARVRLYSGFGFIALGDYDQMGPYSAQTSFKGDHSAWVHIRKDQPVGTVHFHDPLNTRGFDLPWTRFVRYWRKPGGDVVGYAGFVRIVPPDVPVNVVSVHPLAGNQTRVFDVYAVNNGHITSARQAVTRGFSAAASVPGLYQWPAKATERYLVQLTSGSLTGSWIDARWSDAL